jgi:hypothetical protein
MCSSKVNTFEENIEVYESKESVSENGYCLLKIEDNVIMAAEFNYDFNTGVYFVPILQTIGNKIRKFDQPHDLNQYIKAGKCLNPSIYTILNSKCMNCKTSLKNHYKDRHHCRVCGIIVCKNCISKKRHEKAHSLIENENNHNK